VSADALTRLATTTGLKVVFEQLAALLAHSPVQVDDGNPQTGSLSLQPVFEPLSNGLGSTDHFAEEGQDVLATVPDFLEESLTVQDFSVAQRGLVEEHQGSSQELQRQQMEHSASEIILAAAETKFAVGSTCLR